MKIIGTGLVIGALLLAFVQGVYLFGFLENHDTLDKSTVYSTVNAQSENKQSDNIYSGKSATSIVYINNQINIQIFTENNFFLDDTKTNLQEYCRENTCSLIPKTINGGMSFMISGNDLAERIPEIGGLVYGKDYQKNLEGLDTTEKYYGKMFEGNDLFEDNLYENFGNSFSPFDNSSLMDDTETVESVNI